MELNKEVNPKQVKKEWIELHKASRLKETRSATTLLSFLNQAQEGDFSWVEQFDKKLRLMPLLDEDAKQLAEQLFYYYVMTDPNQVEALYWKTVLDNMYPEMAETGIFEALYESANFTLESFSGEETVVNQDLNTVSVQVSPNPFNPTTRLQFSLPSSAQVTIQVFDIMGRVVKTLTNSAYQQGNHSVTFDAARLASGVYFARTTIVANGKSPVVETSKLLLIK